MVSNCQAMRCPLSSFATDRRKAGRPPVLTEDERRQRILDAAEASFTEKGYAATSMDDVARRCAMSKKTLYRSFATKDLLFAELVETALSSLPDYPLTQGEPEQDAQATLRRALQSILELVLHPRQMALARLVVAEASLAPELAVSLHEKGLLRAQSNLTAVIGTLRARGQLQPHVGDDIGSFLLSAAIGDRAITHLIGCQAAPTREEIAERIDRLFVLFGKAIFAEGSGENGERARSLHDAQ